MSLEARLRSHLQALDQPRNPYRHPQAHAKARSYLRAVLKAQGREVTEQVFASEHGEGVNLVGHPTDQARGPSHLLVAHYDTVNDSPGADDNGSAVAVALEVAERCLGVEIVLPDLEEVGLLGARHFVGQDGHRDVPAVVLESVGYWTDLPGSQSYPEILPLAFPHIHQALKDRDMRGNFLALLHLDSDEQLGRSLEQALCLSAIRLSIPRSALSGPGARGLADFGRSDHLAFWEAGRPCLMLTDSANFRNPNYHLPTDLWQTLDLAAMARLVRHLSTFFNSADLSQDIP